MDRIGLWVPLFRPGFERFTADAIQACLELVTSLDVLWLRHSRATPPLYRSGVRYKQEPFPEDPRIRPPEEWRTIPMVLAGLGGPRLRGDCEDLACWRAAELRVSGVDPGARAGTTESRDHLGRRIVHVIVIRGDGRTEDPSRKLGMT